MLARAIVHAACASLVTACPGSQHPSTADAASSDGGPGADSASTDPYRHTITIDGVNDFTTGETFQTTTAGYAAYLTWDDANLYIGYAGADISVAATDSNTKWIFVYFDADPGAGTGARASETYNTQAVAFPSGFGAERYYRWKTDSTLEDIKLFSGSAWNTDTAALNGMVTGEFMETAIPLAALGTPSTLGIATWMINEKSGVEWTYAGLYGDTLVDGYSGASAPITPAIYLEVDFSSPLAPNNVANER